MIDLPPAASEDEDVRRVPSPEKHAGRDLLPKTVAGHLLLLAVVVLVPVLVLQAIIYYDRLQTRRAQEFQANLELARSVALTFEAYVQDILRQEHAIARALIHPPAWSQADIEAYLIFNAERYPALLAFNWLDAEGTIVASEVTEARGLNLNDRPYVRSIQGGAEWVVSNLLDGRSSGKPAFVVATGARDDTGQLLGIVTAEIDAGGLGSLLPLRRGEEGAVAILDRTGLLVYRFPEVAWTWESRDLMPAQGHVLGPALAGEEVTGTFISAIDGRARISGLAPIESTGWVASANRDEEAAMAPIYASFARDLGLLLFVVLGGLVSALFISRQITRPMSMLHAQAKDMHADTPPPPMPATGIAEVDDVARAFHEMAGRVRAREEERADLMRTISHDLRQPLTVIQGQAQMAEILLARGETNGRVMNSLVAIHTNARRMGAMIRDMVESTRLESGQLQLRLEPVNLYSFLTDAIEHIISAEEHPRVEIETPDWTPVVEVDAERAERIVANLITNALKYSPPQSPVRLRIVREGSQAVIQVIDQGPGIVPEDRERIFERYYRSSGTTEASGARKPDGLGLGLYIARRIAEAHGGRLWCESEPGKGSTFYFSLPTA